MKFWKKVLILFLAVLGIGIVVKTTGTEKKSPKVSEEIPLKFAVMADIHSDEKNLKKALNLIKLNNSNFLIILGDLTTLGKKDELLKIKEILEESGIKYYVIPGNHDIWWGRQYKKNLWMEIFGKSFDSFRIDNHKFILLNNADGVEGFGVIGKDGREQVAWLQEEVEECLRLYCLAFLHMPLSHPTSLHVMGEDNPKVASEASELIELFLKNNIKEIFAGHLHFSSEYNLGGLHTTIVGAITKDRNLQSPKFLEIWQEGGNFAKKEVFLEN